jgi:hypothetical protein
MLESQDKQFLLRMMQQIQEHHEQQARPTVRQTMFRNNIDN